MADPSDPSISQLWILTTLVVTALCLAQILSTYATAFLAAPREIAVFVDAVDFSIREDEGHDRDVARVQRLDDKLRLGRLLREIRKGGDDLRDDLNRLRLAEHGAGLRAGARLLWASHRRTLEERLRRLDMLRTRFLVVYMGIVAATINADREKDYRVSAKMTAPCDTERAGSQQQHHDAHRPKIPKGFLDGLKKKHSLTMIKTTPMGHSEKAGQPHRMGWMGVVQELQRSPVMARRHASIEQAMSTKSPPMSPPLSPPMSPLHKPLGSSPLFKTPPPKSLNL